MRYFLHLAYNGTQYRGWQRQASVISIQSVLEDSISKMVGHKVFVHGCGRTDAQVHAFQYFAHIDLDEEFDYDFLERINWVLPPDISIYEMIAVAKNAHTQYDAKKRTYEYYFHLDKIPGLDAMSSYYKTNEFDLDAVNQGVRFLSETSDFRSLCKSPDLYKHTLCKITHIELLELKNRQFRLTISADRFLRSMIRNVVLRLIEIGQGKLPLDHFIKTVKSRESFDYPYQKIGFPQGLFLSKVEYEYLSRDVIK